MSDAPALPRVRVRARPPRSLPLFASVVLGVFAMLHLVIGWRLLGMPRWPAELEAVGIFTLGVLYLSVPAALASRVLGDRVPSWLSGVGFRWLGLAFYWFVLSALAEPVVRLGARAWPTLPWAEGGAGVVGVAGLAISAFALAGARTPPVRRVEVPVPGLDPGLEGLRIAQLSDLHVGHTIRRPFVQAVVDRTNAERPDLVALTGDFVDGSVADLAHDAAPLGELHAPLGVYFVTGNHEYFTGTVDAWCERLRHMGIHVLRNERRTVLHDGAPLDVLGIDDPFANAPGHGPDLARAIAGRDRSHASILLAHQPVFGEAAAAAGVSLVLSGHTHGGQLWPFHALVKLVQPYVAGLVRIGATALYVSRGTGWWGPPMRLGAPNEITLLTLRRA